MSMKSALKDAGALMARRDKITKAIAREVGKLGETVERLAEVELGLREVNAKKLLGEATESDGNGAEKELRACRTEIDGLSENLAALRGQLPKMAPATMERYRALEAELPAHNAAIEEEFRREWAKAVANFSAALAKRALVEESIGRKLQLTEPNAASASVSASEMGAPKEMMKTLRGHLESLTSSAPPRYAAFETVMRPYDSRPYKIYVLGKAFQDQSGPVLQAGTKVIEQMLEPGWLDHLVAVGDAFSMPDPAAANSCEIRQSLSQIDAAEQAAQRARDAEGLRPIDRPPASQEPVDVPALASPFFDAYSSPGPSHGGVVQG